MGNSKSKEQEFLLARTSMEFWCTDNVALYDTTTLSEIFSNGKTSESSTLQLNILKYNGVEQSGRNCKLQESKYIDDSHKIQEERTAAITYYLKIHWSSVEMIISIAFTSDRRESQQLAEPKKNRKNE